MTSRFLRQHAQSSRRAVNILLILLLLLYLAIQSLTLAAGGRILESMLARSGSSIPLWLQFPLWVVLMPGALVASVAAYVLVAEKINRLDPLKQWQLTITLLVLFAANLWLYQSIGPLSQFWQMWQTLLAVLLFFLVRYVRAYAGITITSKSKKTAQGKPLWGTFVLCALTLFLLTQRQAGILLALLVPLILLSGLWRIRQQAERRKEQAARLGIWLITFVFALAAHGQYAQSARQAANQAVSQILQYRAKHGTWPAHEAQAGFSAGRWAMNYQLHADAPILSYRATFRPFAGWYHDFDSGNWLYETTDSSI